MSETTSSLVVLTSMNLVDHPFGVIGCSNCKTPMPVIDYGCREFKYCPYCGAEFIKEEDDEKN